MTSSRLLLLTLQWRPLHISTAQNIFAGLKAVCQSFCWWYCAVCEQSENKQTNKQSSRPICHRTAVFLDIGVATWATCGQAGWAKLVAVRAVGMGLARRMLLTSQPPRQLAGCRLHARNSLRNLHSTGKLLRQTISCHGPKLLLDHCNSAVVPEHSMPQAKVYWQKKAKKKRGRGSGGLFMFRPALHSWQHASSPLSRWLIFVFLQLIVPKPAFSFVFSGS